MATGLDELIEFLLSEIALCGTQGAGSADLHRFIHKFYQTNNRSDSDDASGPGFLQAGLGRSFYDTIWKWVTTHSDIRIVHNSQVCHYSLTEFETVEQTEPSGSRITSGSKDEHHSSSSAFRVVQPANSLLSLRGTLRQQLLTKGQFPEVRNGTSQVASSLASLVLGNEVEQMAQRQPRRWPEPDHIDGAVFDEPSSTTTMPRLYASQNRIWQALTGHSIDLKKVPTMEFALLSLIAANGASGITQPDLTQFSGQDKRSVPHRTDELARKGYIAKNPIQAGKARTSLCVHTKFVTQNHFTSSGAMEDVFQEGTFVASGFAQLLYNELKDAGVVPTREIRKRLGVPMRTWNKRAVQGALIRLDQTGMIKRFRVRKRKTEDSWVICIQVQRRPRPEDLENLKFRRQAPVPDTTDELLHDDGDGDTLMRDLEVEMLEDGDEVGTSNSLDEDIRIPPQWTPERLLANTIFDVTAQGQAVGWDALVLRDRIVGPFWRRPMESYVTRLTDDWERTQPPHLRHLAIIRDTRNTEEKKFIHYVYRTYRHFQQAVLAGEAVWDGVTRSITSASGVSNQTRKEAKGDIALDAWGFHNLNQKQFVRFDGTATLSDVRAAIVNPRKYGPRWDNALAEEIGYQKMETPLPKCKVHRRSKGASNDHKVPDKVFQNDGDQVLNKKSQADGDINEQAGISFQSGRAKVSKVRKKTSGLILSPEQRIILGLKPTGRLSKSAMQQILAHRRETDNSISLPDKIIEEPVSRGHAPLMTKEERLAENLPLKGRLGLSKENAIREKRGMPKLVEKAKKKPVKKEAAILTRQQRIALGFKGHGRLHQHFVDALRREQEDDIPLEESPAVKAYRDWLKAEAEKGPTLREKTVIPGAPTPTKEGSLRATSIVRQEDLPTSFQTDAEVEWPTPTTNIRKRRANSASTTPSTSKRPRTLSDSLSGNVAAALHQSNGLSNDVSTPAKPYNGLSSDQLGHDTVVPDDGLRRARQVRQSSKIVPTERGPYQPDITGLFAANDLNGDDNTARSSPGLYVYPCAKRRAMRGRPRNACIAVFRFARLSEFPWFESRAQNGHESSHIIYGEAAKPALMSSRQHNEAEASSSAFSSVRTCPQSTGALEPKTTLESDTPTDSSPRALPPVSGTREGHGVGSRPSAENRRYSKPKVNSAVLDEIDEQAQCPETLQQPAESGSMVDDTRMQEGHTLVALHQSSTLPTEPNISRQELRPSTVADWKSTKTSAQHTQPLYHSPYAPSFHSGLMATTQEEYNATVTNLPTTSRTQTPLPETNGFTFLPQGVVGAIAEVEHASTNTPKKTSTRSAGAGIIGSQLKFRREIILEIIDRCGGVFPLHGEIWRPFSAMWDQRHGHTNIPKPGSSTVTDTLKYMISSPNYDLKRMAFLVKARNASGTKERVMVTKADMAPNDQKVMRLAHNMANHALDKSHQYFPKEIRDLFEYETSYVPLPVAPKVENVTLDQIYSRYESSIKESIKENRNRRQREKAAQKKREKEAAKKQNELVEKVVATRRKQAKSGPREKRTRLASLNDRTKRYRRTAVQLPTLEHAEEVLMDVQVREPSPAGSDSSEDVPLMSLRPLISDIVDRGANDEEASLSDVEEVEDEVLGDVSHTALDLESVSFTHPVVRLHSATGTFSTFFSLSTSFDTILPPVSTPAVHDLTHASKSKKRIRTNNSATDRNNKKVRNGKGLQYEKLDEEFVYSSTEDSDATSSEDEEEEVRPKQKQKRRKTVLKRQIGKKLPVPTLLERLTGLTGDPSDPVYKDPKQRRRPVHEPSWAERKRKQLNKLRKDREYAEGLDHADKFKKLCLTLVLASSMSGEDGSVNWSIVEKVYARDNFFNQLKVKRIWSWIHTHMAVQLAELVHTLQSNLIAAYDAGRLPTIDDPEVYDWAGLVRWTMRTCAYPELPLPSYRESLKEFMVDESRYATVDRAVWYGKKVADATRTQLQLQLPFVVPFHRKYVTDRSFEDMVLKARSWIRANTATPQSVYDANKAHEKLKVLGEDILVRVVGDYVQQEHLKMRKLKRQLPGRNYTFTKKFAKTYKRPFELEDFMIATTVKKELDEIFSDEDPEKRFYSISRCEEDGSIMALMSLVSDGKVKLVPRLPHVNNEFGGPLPRLSKWGFCEGDYIHRAIDRNRLFWDTYVVPTSDYQYGNPLQPSLSPAVDWPSLPQPPLPGKHDPDALLPVWSSMDGQSVTWPWWYRILNLVLQPLFLQPGATATDILSHCPEHTAEIFEIELVLGWLDSIGAVLKSIGGGYQVTPMFWAALGDRLLETDDDWFGEHVKRTTKTAVKQQWRDKYNLRYSAMQTRGAQVADTNSETHEQPGMQMRGVSHAMSQQISRNSKAQYSIIQQALLEPTSKETGEATMGSDEYAQIQVATTGSAQQLATTATGLQEEGMGALRVPQVANILDQEVEMVDVGVNAIAEAEGDDMDAEGEVDDAIY